MGTDKPAAAAPSRVPRPPRPRGTTAQLALAPAAARQLDVCTHCGFCLPACPTYVELGTEADSPRGRIDMMGAAFRGETAATDPDLRLHLDRCLDCRACESACPSGVRYHALLEEAVAQLPLGRPAASGIPSSEAAASAAAAVVVRRGLLPLVRRPRLLALAARCTQRLRPLADRLPSGFAAVAAGLPRTLSRPARWRLPAVLPAQGRQRGEVDLFLGCVQDAVFGDENAAIARLLARCGFEVHVVRRAACCGALHVHIGDTGGLRRLAALNLAALGGSGRPVVVGAAGCGAVLKDYGHLLQGTPLQERAAALAARVRDLSEFVAAVPELPMAMPPAGAPVRATWHDPCHLSHAQGVRRQPRELIAAIPGVEYVELPEADVCCGSAGVYNLLQPELSAQILARKVANIAATRARWVVTANPGCALQIRAGLRSAGLDVAVITLGSLLVEAYGGEPR